MNEIILTNDNGEQCITSMQIAEATGKTHAHVLRDIRNMEPGWEKERGTKFGFMQIREEIPNGGYRMRPCFKLTKVESLYVATKFNDEARARLVLRWAELEKGLRSSMSMESKKLLVTEQEILQRGDQIRREQIEKENEPSDGCFTTSEIAKEMELTTKQLNKLLVEAGVQYFNGGRYKVTPEFSHLGLTKDRSFHYYSLEGEKKERLYLVWTQEGREWIEENPMFKVSKKQENKGRVRFLTNEEKNKLLTECKNISNELYLLVLIAITSGARYSEITNLKWQNIDFTNRLYHFLDTKNGDDRGVPISNIAYDALEDFGKVRQLKSDYIFANKKGGIIYFRNLFYKAIENAGIENFHFHDLRHTAASYLAMNGASLLEIAEILGHKTLSMVKRYSHLTQKHTATLINKMVEKEFGNFN